MGELQDQTGTRSRSRSRRYDEPPLPAPLILGAVGVLAGAIAIGTIRLSERGCEQFRGSSNCGRWGLPLLILTVVVTIVLGAVALDRLAMPHPRLVAFLGVSLMLLVMMGFLADSLFTSWALLVVPLLSAVTFGIAHLIAGWLERAGA